MCSSILLVGITVLWPVGGLAMKAGVSKRDITVPELLEGAPNVHDPLFARVLALDDGDNAVAIICLDLADVFFPEVWQKIRNELGIARVLINCSHTHSDGRNSRKEGWEKKVGEIIFETVKEAYADMIPVSLHTGRAEVQIGHNRYGDSFTQEIVPWVNMLEARGGDGRPFAVLFEHATHPVMTTGTGTISADFPGYAIRHIDKELGDVVMTMFAQGCAGNINPEAVGEWIEGGQFEKTEKSGRELGDAVLTALRNTTEIMANKFTTRSKTIMLPFDLPSMELWEKTIKRIKVGGEVPPREGWADSESTYKYMDVVKGMILRGERPERLFTINIVMLGSEWGLVTMPDNVFSEYELWINAFAPFKHSMVFAFTNGVVDYICTDVALAMGIKTPIVAESACMEAGSFPGFFHGVRIDGAYLQYAVGIEVMIKEAIASLWTE